MIRTYDRRNLKRIYQILDVTAVTYKKPHTGHFLLKLEDTNCFRYFATYMKRKIKQNYSYAISYEYKDGEVGLHAHLMMVIDAVGMPTDMIFKRIRKQVLGKLKGVRIADDGTASASLECRKIKGNKTIPFRAANGQLVYSHDLKLELEDAKDRFRYLAKIEQKEGVTSGQSKATPKAQKFKSRLNPPACADILNQSEVHECYF
jgi:hypothetical protein